MTITKDDIIALPNEHLRQRSKKIGIIDDKIRQLVADMEAATLDWEDSRAHEVGVALAAVQLDRHLRAVVVRNDFDDKENRAFTVFINPVIVKRYGDVTEDFEGCLSVKDIYGKVPRYSKVKIKALGIDGKELRVNAEGFLARVFQHEIDHTNGIVFVDHIKEETDAFYQLKEDGQLEPLDYEKDIRKSNILW